MVTVLHDFLHTQNLYQAERGALTAPLCIHIIQCCRLRQNVFDLKFVLRGIHLFGNVSLVYLVSVSRSQANEGCERFEVLFKQ